MTETYDPRRDSSPGTDDLRHREGDTEPGVDGGVILVTDDGKGNRTCACGCGRRVAGKVRFVQGHDQRLIGILVRASRNGQEIHERSGGVMVPGEPIGYARRVLTGNGVAKLVAAINRPAPQPKTRKAVAVVAEPIEGIVKVGRWDYPATRSADGAVSRCVRRDGSGDWMSADDKVAATFKPTV